MDRTTLEDLTTCMDVVAKQSKEIDEWHKILDESLQIKFEEQNVIISEVLEEQKAKMDSHFHTIMDV
eukprot:2173168-Ditylum_brightwellii.AAC.1